MTTEVVSESLKMTGHLEERFSGHESFVCRYGWLPKVFRAVGQNPTILKDELGAMHTLGIGRNMVKSLQFWGESTGVIERDDDAGHRAGPVGARLMSRAGWDPYLESHESLWLIHWWLTSYAKLSAWSEVFGDGGLQRFDRKTLVDRLGVRARDKARPLASSTLEQHAGIFIQSYLKEDRSSDDTSWCPLQDLGLLSQAISVDGRTGFTVSNRQPQGLTERVFATCLLDYIQRRGASQTNVPLSDILRGDYSPGTVFCLDELTVRRFVDDLSVGVLRNCLRFNDTADTQSVVVNINNAPDELVLAAGIEVLDV
ncbi:DUF4007 family protein [Niveibacterium sp. 24ML]|uniref:DUF4007 family protein n=1 Tax=Niveibacterium sp. 24ML TaxID=2985512 RepID=UPI002271C5F5|nr:DUF4007 family protein [Niveibacterium sp. 24ML]MCX9158535.1 DUF4007 family protein [Niveibacterium sp. 24ML]